MKKLPRKWINQQLNEGLPVQVAIAASNACFWAYLTTSGKVCRKEHGYCEDVTDEDKYNVFSLPKMTFSSVVRLQNALERMD